MSKSYKFLGGFPYREISGTLNLCGIRARMLLRENIKNTALMIKQQGMENSQYQKSSSLNKISIIRLNKQTNEANGEKPFNEIYAEQKERISKANYSKEKIEKAFYDRYLPNCSLKASLPIINDRQKTQDSDEVKKTFAFLSTKPVQSEIFLQNANSFKDMLLNSRQETTQVFKNYKKFRVVPGTNQAEGRKRNSILDHDNSIYDTLFQSKNKMTKYGMVNLNTLKLIPVSLRSHSQTVNNSIEGATIDQSMNFQIKAFKKNNINRRLSIVSN